MAIVLHSSESEWLKAVLSAKDNAPVNLWLLSGVQRVVGRLEIEQNELLQVFTDPNSFKKRGLIPATTIRLGEVSAVIDAYNTFAKNFAEWAYLTNELDQLKCSDQGLHDLKNQADQELRQSWDKLVDRIVATDPMDRRNAFVEIQLGAGWQETHHFVQDLAVAYSKWLTAKGFVLEVQETGDRSVRFYVRGSGAYRLLKNEIGVHRFETKSQRDLMITSSVTVAVFPEATREEFVLRPEDLKITTNRAQGAGGQHVNTTNSRVCVEHLPTGTRVEIQDERSQKNNRQTAIELLRARLFAEQEAKAQRERAAARREQLGSRSQSERVRNYDKPAGSIKDERLGGVTFSWDEFFSGAIDPLHQSLSELELKLALEEIASAS